MVCHKRRLLRPRKVVWSIEFGIVAFSCRKLPETVYAMILKIAYTPARSLEIAQAANLIHFWGIGRRC